jgi:hypothetical protein
MIKMKMYLLLAICFGNGSCSTKKELAKPEIQRNEIGVGDNKNYVLSNRLSTCDHRLTFMKSVVKADTAWVHIIENIKPLKAIGQIEITIVGEKGKTELQDSLLYYVDLACFKNMKISEVLDILCKKNHLQRILETIEVHGINVIFEVIISNMQGFNIIVKDDKIVSSTWHKITKSH